MRKASATSVDHKLRSYTSTSEIDCPKPGTVYVTRAKLQTKSQSSLKWNSPFCREGGSPQHARIDPIGINFEHFIVKFYRSRSHPVQPIKIANVLPGLFDDSGAVLPPESLVSCNHRSRIERFDFIKCRYPLVAFYLI